VKSSRVRDGLVTEGMGVTVGGGSVGVVVTVRLGDRGAGVGDTPLNGTQAVSRTTRRNTLHSNDILDMPLGYHTLQVLASG